MGDASGWVSNAVIAICHGADDFKPEDISLSITKRKETMISSLAAALLKLHRL